MTTEDIFKAQRELKAWHATKAGGAFQRYDSAIANAWVADCNERLSMKTLKEKWEVATKAKEELIAAIKELQGL